VETEGDIPPQCRLGNAKAGVDYTLEERADALLAQSRREHPRSQDEDPYEVLSPGQMDRRRSREIYNKNGFPEPHLFAGLYRRAHNPKMFDRPPRGTELTEDDNANWDPNGGWGAP